MYDTPAATSTAELSTIPDGSIDLMKEAWRRLKTWPAPTLMGLFIGMGGTFVMMLVLYLVLGLGIGIVSVIGAMLASAFGMDEDTVGVIVSILIVLMSLVLYPAIFAGVLIGQMTMFRGALATARGETMEVGALFAGLGRKAPRGLLIMLLTMLALIPSMLLLYVPAVYLGLRWSMSFHYLLDTNLGAIDSMKASWRATEGKVLDLFLTQLVVGLVSMALVLITCYVGSIVVLPVQMVILSLLYIKHSGRDRSGMPDPELI